MVFSGCGRYVVTYNWREKKTESDQQVLLLDQISKHEII